MSNSIVKRVLDWNEKKAKEVENNLENEKHPYLKAWVHGSIDGFIDSAVAWYIPLIALTYYWKKKAEKKD